MAGPSTRAATLKAQRAAEWLCFNDGGSDGSGSGSDDGSGSGSDDVWREIAAEEEELVTGAMGMTAGIFVTVPPSTSPRARRS